jgi:hypothetical protein
MRALSAPDLLKVWETARLQPPLLRAVAVLAAVEPGMTFDDIVRLPLGQRDRLLLDLYSLLFGERLNGSATCPQCSEQLEVSIGVPEVQSRAAPATPPGGTHEIRLPDRRVRFRLPNTEDLLAAANAPAAEEAIISRCVLDVRKGRRKFTPDSLADSARERLSARMLGLDPLAEVLLDLRCPACKHEWQMVLDITEFLWSSIVERVERLLGEVHVLASAYGWSEHEVLALSHARRQYYLEAVS